MAQNTYNTLSYIQQYAITTLSQSQTLDWQWLIETSKSQTALLQIKPQSYVFLKQFISSTCQRHLFSLFSSAIYKHINWLSPCS